MDSRVILTPIEWSTHNMAHPVGIEPTTPWLTAEYSTAELWVNNFNSNHLYDTLMEHKQYKPV